MTEKWYCERGHEFVVDEGEVPYFQLKIETKRNGSVTGKLCPQCLVEFLDNNVHELKKEGDET